MISIEKDPSPGNPKVKIGAGYQLEGEVSRGPNASIYRATAPGDNRTVAIKVFHERYHTDPRFAIRFREHLRRLAGLTHDSLVNVLDYGVDQKRHYIVMEWVEGVDLGIYISEFGPLPPALSIWIARQVCAALAAIHERNLIHQGIKPRNILLTPEGQVKVTDVGLSGLLSESGLSKTHVMLSGVAYISPEQARGKRPTSQSDIYSLGATLFEMLTGRLPYQTNDPWSMVRMHARENVPSPTQFNQQVPGQLADIVTRALQKDPELRFPSAVEMDSALAALHKDLELAAAQTGRTDRYPAGFDFVSMLKNFLDPRTIKDLLKSPWQIAGRSLPFGALFIVQFFLAFCLAFAILYALAGFL